jgi:hypothetical protein
MRLRGTEAPLSHGGSWFPVNHGIAEYHGLTEIMI